MTARSKFPGWRTMTRAQRINARQDAIWESARNEKTRFNASSRVDLPGQLDLPQTAPDLAGLAKLKAREPMRPTVPQKPCDTGLFSDQTKQVDLEDLLCRTR